MCHSAGQRAAAQAAVDWWPVPVALAATGRFVCVACDFGDPTVELGPTSAAFSWGNDHALGLVDEAVELVAGPRVGASAGPVVLAATSMGALVALGWARRRPSDVAGVLLGCPVLELRGLYESDRAGLAASVASAFGVAMGEALPDLATHDPAAYGGELQGLDVRIYASADDPVASDTGACRRWAAQATGSDVSVVDLGPCGHWPRGTPVDDAVAFARSL